jgi:hypothetical protein
MKKLLIAGAVAVVLLLPNCTPAKASTLGDILGSVANSYLGGSAQALTDWIMVDMESRPIWEVARAY